MAANLTIKDSLGGTASVYESGTVVTLSVDAGTLVSAITSPNNTLSLGGSNGTVTADINPANSGTYSAVQVFSGGSTPTVTLKSKDGSTLLAAVTPPSNAIPLNQGMTVSWTGTPTVQIVKAV